MRKNPLYRALRVDKMTLAALDATLVEHESGRASERVPVLRMVHAPLEELRARAGAFARALAAAAPGAPPGPRRQRVRGGRRRRAHGRRAHGGRRPRPRPGRPRPPRGPRCAQGTPPVVVRVAEDRVLVDLRTVRPDEEEALLAALAQAARAR